MLRRRSNKVALASAMLAGLLLSGCDILAVPVLIFRPDPSRDAKFTLTKQRMVLLVEDSPSQSPRCSLRADVTAALHKEFRENKINLQVVPEEAVRRALDLKPSSANWSAARVGRELGAAQVVHVIIDPYSPGHPLGDPTIGTTASARVKVYDSANPEGEQLFPVETAGEPVKFEELARRSDGMLQGLARERALAAGLADRIAKLFYKHPISEAEAARGEAAAGPARD